MAKSPDLNYLFLYLGWKCNLNCEHCWVPKDAYDTDSVLSKEKINEILDFVKRKKTKNIKVSGGEPLLYKDTVSDIIKFAQENSINISIETNGTLLDEDFIKDHQYEKLRYSLSLDSANPQENDRFRGMTGAFAQTYDAIKGLLKYGINFNLTYSTYDGDETKIDQIIEFAARNTISNIKINPVIKMGRAENYDQSDFVTTISPEKILELYTKYCIRPIKGVVVSIMVPPALSGIYFLKDIAQKCPENICANCPTMNLLSILPNGDVGLCAEAYRSSTLRFGNINDKTLDEIWNSDCLNNFRDQILNNLQGICGECLLKEICWGGCRTLAIKKYGNVNSPNPFCEDFNKRGRFIFKKSK